MGPINWSALSGTTPWIMKRFMFEGMTPNCPDCRNDPSPKIRKRGICSTSRGASNRGGKERQLNVILISIESLSAEFLTRFGNREGITPFMDGLQKESLFFTQFFATGTRTDRGLEAITLSIPPTPGRSLVKRPDNEHIYNLGFEFKNRGYDVAFLYGGRGYFDNMNAFFSGNGYRIIDQTDLKSSEVTFKNAWGVSDEDLYRKTLREADAAYGRGSHFFYHVMTTSNHRPFHVPGREN